MTLDKENPTTETVIPETESNQNTEPSKAENMPIDVAPINTKAEQVSENLLKQESERLKDVKITRVNFSKDPSKPVNKVVELVEPAKTTSEKAPENTDNQEEK